MKIIRPVQLLDSMLNSSNVPETSPAANEWNPGTPYVVGNEVTVTYTGAGASIATHLVYICNLNHTNKDPTLDANRGAGNGWDIKDATNRWRAFNGVLQQETTNSNTIEYNFTPGSIVTAAAFFGVNAQSVTLTMTDPIDGVVFDETQSAISASGITDWYKYFYEEIIRIDRILFEDMPAYPLATINVVVDDTGSTAELGELAFGNAMIIGDSQNGATFGIVDYSVKNTDAEGNVTISEGAFADTADINVVIQTSRFDHINSTLKNYRATPIVWIASSELLESMLYGYFRNYRNVISGPVVSTTLLQLEGLT